MKKANPESRITCSKCIFCGNNPPSCAAHKNYPITQREYYVRPVWCPFGGRPF